MAKLLIDEIHVSVYVPMKLPASVTDQISNTLDGKQVHVALTRAIGLVFRRYQTLSRCTFNVSR